MNTLEKLHKIEQQLIKMGEDIETINNLIKKFTIAVSCGTVERGTARHGEVRCGTNPEEEKEMKKYKAKIKGSSPIIWNVMNRELWNEIKKLKRSELEEWGIDRKNWQRKAEFDKNGKVKIPERWFKTTMIQSCKKNRIVPHFASRKSETYTSYVENFMVFNKKSLCEATDLKDFGAFVGATGKNSTTKVWRVRPLLEEWNAEFEIIDAAGRMREDELKEIIDYAGLMIGIGDNRINNFGRFELMSLEELK